MVGSQADVIRTSYIPHDMDQDSFRRLLNTSKPNGSRASTLGISSSSRAKLVVSSTVQKVATPQPSFKPRNVKESTDRERKPGGTVKTQANYTERIEISEAPTKGLNFALLEQEKAKAAQLTKDDVAELEQAFAEHLAKPAEQVVAKKRTREDIIRELKRDRAEGEQAPKSEDLEAAKQSGRFKPIGFKAIGSSGTRIKRKESGDGETDKKKKRKIAEGEKKEKVPEAAPSTNKAVPARPISLSAPLKPPEGVDDLDIFADAGDYTGVDTDEQESDEEAATVAEATETSMPLRRWIAMDDEPGPNSNRLAQTIEPTPLESKNETKAIQTEEEPIQLAPLESSALPSIRDLLAMDDAAIKYEKKQKRREKRKRGSKTKEVGSDDD